MQTNKNTCISTEFAIYKTRLCTEVYLDVNAIFRIHKVAHSLTQRNAKSWKRNGKLSNSQLIDIAIQNICKEDSCTKPLQRFCISLHRGYT